MKLETLGRKVTMSRWRRIFHVMAASSRNRWKFRLGRIDSFSGSSTNRLSAAESVRYINRVYHDFVTYGSITPEWIAGKTVVELGPGDNIGVLLRFLASGAVKAYGADRFYSTHDIEHERQIYKELRAGLSEVERRRFDDAVELDPKLKFNDAKVQYVYGKGAQRVDEMVPPNSVDLIISRGVLQEVYEIDKTFRAMDRILKPGGSMVHKIDLRDYGIFSSLGYHPREFLTVPGWAYHWMANNTDKPSRRMLNYYREKMAQMKYEAEFYLTGLVVDGSYSAVEAEIFPHKKSFVYGVDYSDEHRRLIEEIRPRLQPEFRNLTDEDLLASATMLVGRKPRA